MDKYIILFSSLFLSACFCPVEVGDTVVNEVTGQIGIVKSIDKRSNGTENCRCAVLHDDGTWSRNNNIITGENLSAIDARYVYNWEYMKVNK